MMIDDEILELFREESREHLAALEGSLLDLETAEDMGSRRGIIDDLFRHAHSVKGAARAVGLNQLQDLGQQLEDTLDALRDDPEHATGQMIGKALSQFDALRDAYNSWEAEGEGEAAEPPPESSGETVATDADPAAEKAAPQPESPTVDSEPPAQRRARGPRQPAGASPIKPAAAAKASEDRSVVRVPAERLDRMLSLAGEVRVSQRGGDSLESQMDALRELLAATLTASKRLSGLRAPSVPEVHSRSVKERVEQLGARVESAIERLRQIQSDLGKKRFREELLVEGLEQDIRSARLVPLASLTDSMRRGVRDLVQSLGKSVLYEPDVGDILLDKAVMESLKDPLMHLIRNAVDHGIEGPEERLAAGKPGQGTIAIQATRRGESVLIRIRDDGRGIAFDRIRDKLKQQPNVDLEEVGSFSQQELARFLFQPGFTTKQSATDVSGRGVGLNVVLDAVHRLQGTVELEESSPAGTTFLITVPVTISTSRILTVTSAGWRYGIPTAAMLRTGRLSRSELRRIQGKLFLAVDGTAVRWVELSDVLGFPSKQVSENGDQRAYLLLAHEGRKLALAVDEFEDESEVILKSLEFPLTEMDEVIGGTIRPNGSVQLVLDPGWIMSRALHVVGSVAPAEPNALARLLVVDDSPTTRTVLRNVLSAAGYAVQTAADGVEAVERLRAKEFDIVLCDVEMPRMDGFEVTRQVKARFGIPVVLITGREKEDDRREGLRAGADAYVVKSSYEARGLLEIIEQLVG